MSDKDEALRLAKQLKERFAGTVPTSQAASCLRRQHAEIAALESQRDELLESLQKLLAYQDPERYVEREIWVSYALDAISKATGGNDE